MQNFKQVIIVNNDLKMSKGKIASQVAHASLEAYLHSSREIQDLWRKTGAKKIVLKASESEIIEIYKNIPNYIPKVLIFDKGLTQVSPNSLTALGIGPFKEEEIDKYTKHLKLL